VIFEQWNEPGMKTNAKGIAATSDGRIAWFKDPDGNTFAVEQ
jgi:hypothetical protein